MRIHVLQQNRVQIHYWSAWDTKEKVPYTICTQNCSLSFKGVYETWNTVIRYREGHSTEHQGYVPKAVCVRWTSPAVFKEAMKEVRSWLYYRNFAFYTGKCVGGRGNKNKTKNTTKTKQQHVQCPRFFLITSLVTSNWKEVCGFVFPPQHQKMSSLLTANSQSRTCILLLLLNQQKFQIQGTSGSCSSNSVIQEQLTNFRSILQGSEKQAQRATAGRGKQQKGPDHRDRAHYVHDAWTRIARRTAT